MKIKIIKKFIVFTIFTYLSQMQADSFVLGTGLFVASIAATKMTQKPTNPEGFSEKNIIDLQISTDIKKNKKRPLYKIPKIDTQQYFLKPIDKISTIKALRKKNEELNARLLKTQEQHDNTILNMQQQYNKQAKIAKYYRQRRDHFITAGYQVETKINEILKIENIDTLRTKLDDILQYMKENFITRSQQKQTPSEISIISEISEE